MPEEEWRRILGTNLDAVFYWAQEGARRMLAAGKRGAIVNIASVLGFGVAKGTAAYATAKAGVIQLTKALALELAFKGIRVNAIAPGWIVTDLNRDFLESEGRRHQARIPVGRFGDDARPRRRAAAACLRRRPLHHRRDRGGRRRPDGGAARVAYSFDRDAVIPGRGRGRSRRFASAFFNLRTAAEGHLCPASITTVRGYGFRQPASLASGTTTR